MIQERTHDMASMFVSGVLPRRRVEMKSRGEGRRFPANRIGQASCEIKTLHLDDDQVFLPLALQYLNVRATRIILYCSLVD